MQILTCKKNATIPLKWDKKMGAINLGKKDKHLPIPITQNDHSINNTNLLFNFYLRISTDLNTRSKKTTGISKFKKQLGMKKLD